MAVEKDQSAWLPEPPPPRPARRDAAIEAALRKFDGVEEAAPVMERPRPSWASAHRPQLAMIVSAMLLVIVGIPAVLIGLRNPPEKAPPAVTAPKAVLPSGPPAAPVAPAPEEKVPQAAPPAPQPPAAPPAPEDRRVVADLKKNEPVAQTAPPMIAAAPPPAAPVVAAAPPPPAPPPPPPPAAVASNGQAAEREMADNMIVTGSRVARPALEAPAPAKVISPAQSYAGFLSRLQLALRAGNRSALIGMIGFPLRVNYAEGARIYRDARAVERDFDRIFTPKVKRAIAGQRAERLFVRDQGAMVGDGELWFRESCANTDCSRPGPVRIVAVNP